MSFCRLAWKGKVVKAVEALTDQHVGRIGEWVGGLRLEWSMYWQPPVGLPMEF